MLNAQAERIDVRIAERPYPSVEWTFAGVSARRLIAICQSKNGKVVPGLADDLQSERKPPAVEAAGHADRRQAVIIGEHGVFGRQRQRVSVRLPDRRSDCRRGRQQQQIDFAETFRDSPPVRIDGGRTLAEIGEGRGGGLGSMPIG